jgi:hypothetical protein
VRFLDLQFLVKLGEVLRSFYKLVQPTVQALRLVNHPLSIFFQELFAGKKELES